jgi:hypothetical protein
MTTTIVSAFLSNVNERYSDSLERYYNNGILLIKSVTPKIIFVDELMYDMIGNNYDETNTLIVKISKSDLYLYNYTSYLTKFNLNSTNQLKDTLEFMFTMCNKTEWINQAINLNKFNTNNFIWIDFGIRYILNEQNMSYCTDEEFMEKINQIQHKTYDDDKVRIGKIWDLTLNYNIDIYKDIAWYFAGGIFGGNITSLTNFADLMKKKCIEIMVNKNTIIWEVNIWYLIYIENTHLFDTYYCNHNKSLIDNY